MRGVCAVGLQGCVVGAYAVQHKGPVAGCGAVVEAHLHGVQFVDYGRKLLDTCFEFCGLQVAAATLKAEHYDVVYHLAYSFSRVSSTRGSVI